MIKKFKVKSILSLLLAVSVFLTGCSSSTNVDTTKNEQTQTHSAEQLTTDKVIDKSEESSIENEDLDKTETYNKETEDSSKVESTTTEIANNKDNIFAGYKLIEVDGGNLSGHREPNVVVDIGFGDREYWAFTNEYGQLVRVIASKIELQDDSREPVTSSGRYYKDEAKVPGVESKYLDEGHVIADSLGGVSNAYNITPQNSTLNRHGDQAYMEENIRKAGGCTNFEAIITYPNTTTQIPSHYSYTYTLKGKVIHDEFDNVNPDEVNASLNSNTSTNSSSSNANTSSSNKNNTATSSSNTNTNASSSNVNNSSSNTNSSATVYWTPNGKSYHTTKGCSTLSRSKTVLSGTISESGKNDPCDRCH